MLRLDHDRGSVSLFLVLLGPAILALSALVIDGGGVVVANQRAADLAEQGARAGANAIDIDELRGPTGARQIDCATAGDKVRGYFGAYTGDDPPDSAAVTACDPGRITVTVTVSYQPIFPLFGSTFVQTQKASASPICAPNTLCSGP